MATGLLFSLTKTNCSVNIPVSLSAWLGDMGNTFLLHSQPEGPPGDANNELTSSCSCSSSSSSSSSCRLDAARQITSPNLLIHHRLWWHVTAECSDSSASCWWQTQSPRTAHEVICSLTENNTFGHQNRKTVTLETNSTDFVLMWRLWKLKWS